MRVLVTGADGFIAKNMIEYLKRINIEISKYTKENSILELENYIKSVDFIFHFAGINRPKNENEFYQGNSNLTQNIVDIILKNNKKIPILLTSSSQVGSDNPYAKSKKIAEEVIEKYSKDNNIDCFIYRLPNVFGKWSKPNYNSVIATWCYNITRDIDIEISDENIKLNLVYIGDVVHSFAEKLYIKQNRELFCNIEKQYTKTLGEIRDLLFQFKKSRENLLIPQVAEGFERVLYATYLSFLPKDKFSYKLSGYQDIRGTFYEILKTKKSGQLGISTTKPGITR